MVNTDKVKVATDRFVRSYQNWTVYDQDVIDDMVKNVQDVCRSIDQQNKEYFELKNIYRYNFWRPIIITIISIVCSLFFIGFCVYCGTHYSNFKEIAMEEARYEIKKDIFNGHFTLPKTDTLKYTDYSGTKFTIIIMKE